MDDSKKISNDRQLFGLQACERFAQIPIEDALDGLDKSNLWIRSVNIEFSFRYAIVESSKTQQRFVVVVDDGVRAAASEDLWARLLGWLADPWKKIEIRIGDADLRSPSNRDHR